MQHSRIGFDMDDVICDTYGSLRLWAEKSFAIPAHENLDQPIQALLDDVQIHQMTAMLNEGSFFRSLTALPQAVDVLESLVRRHDVFIVTAAMEHPACMLHKFDWISEYLPFFNPLNIVFCGEKYVADVHYLVDDSPRHFERLRGEGIVFSAPKNRQEKRYKRFDDWKQIGDFFLRQ